MCLGHISRAAHHSDVALQRWLRIDDIVRHILRQTDLEGILISNLCHAGIEQQLAFCENHNMIKQSLHVVHLMGRDNQRAVLTHILCHHLTELALRGDIHTVGGFVHQQVVGLRSQGDTHIHLFLLTHREGFQVQVGGEFEVFQATFQHLTTEMRVEALHQTDILFQSHCR